MNLMIVANRVVGGVLMSVLMGCQYDATEPSEENFVSAVSQGLERTGGYCLPMDFPVELTSGDLVLNSERRKQMLALESVGLVYATEYGAEERSMLGGTRFTRLPRYELTAIGGEYVGEANRGEGSPAPALCFGAPRLGRIVSWEGPRQVGPSMVATVRYTYSIAELAPWAREAAVQGAFSSIRKRVGGAGTVEESMALRLTDNGWEPVGSVN